jgi:site-specific DNA-adenine methylase
MGVWQKEIRSPLAWIGGKCHLAPKLINLMPDHVCYCEPFGGAAHVLLQKQPSTNEVYNDINGEVVNFFMILRRDPDKLQQACSSLPYARALFDRWWKEALSEIAEGPTRTNAVAQRTMARELVIMNYELHQRLY